MANHQNKQREKIEPARSDTVKKETLWVVAFACLIVGFVGGSAFTIYKTGSKATTNVGMQAPQQQAVSNEVSEQIRHFQAQTRETPDDAFVWIGLGNSYFDAGRSQDAAKAYEKSLSLDPNHADVWTDLGVMYRRAGDPKKAVEAFDRAVTIDPNHEIARFNKGVVLMHDLNDSKGAIESWEKLIQLNPDAKAPNGQTVKALIESFKNR